MGAVRGKERHGSMANKHIDTVLEVLKTAGFSAAMAYPGQAAPAISGTVAAVQLEQLDLAQGAETVAVHILCPASMGGSACEGAAQQAAQALHKAGASCVQDGCVYDRVTQTYRCVIHAVFSTAAVGTGDLAPFFAVVLNGSRRNYANAFRSEETTGCQPEYLCGNAEPVGSSGGKRVWQLRLEEWIPAGVQDLEAVIGTFTLEIFIPGQIETYTGCRWTEITREFSASGLRQVRLGFAQSRKVVSNG